METVDYRTHSAYSDPGAWGALVDPLSTDPAELSVVARNVISHYRAQGSELPDETRDDINLDVDTFGVDVDMPVGGEWFVRSYVFHQLAHRMKDELLLWDGWGVMGHDADESADLLADEIAALLVAADAGDTDAEGELGTRYRADERLHPGDRIMSFSPNSDQLVDVSIER